jgi:hypothetical protein
MTMPIIPGLAGAPAPDDEAPPGVEAALAAVPDDELEGLEASASEAKAAGELDALLGEESAVDDGGDQGDGEDQETPDEELAEGDEEQAEEEDAGEEDPTPHVRAAEDAAKAAAKACDELERLVEDAKQHEKAGIDVDKLGELLDEATESAQEAQDANDDAHGADAEEAAELAKQAQAAQAEVEKALAAAKQSVAGDADGAEEAAVPDEVKAMTAWARKVSGIG